MQQPRYFNSQKKGENYELRAELNSEYRDKRKEAVKKVIANMTLGKDVSSLFADVVKNMQTEDLELKKLIYLYLINYAKSQPELVILAVNTFVKDSDDFNPLIRSLALRTMGCLRVEKIVDYLMDPLKKGLVDKDPYVRKTAVLCIPKLFDLNPEIAISNGLIVMMQEMLSDKNPMVIANTVAALSEVAEASVQHNVFIINDTVLHKLLAALNECTEWGQVSILHALSTYKPPTEKDASDMIDRILPRLQHVNQSVVLAAVKLLMIYLGYNYSQEINSIIIRKLAPPLVTLLSSEPEIQYVVLRNINLILQKNAEILQNDVRVFFIKYNDPLYVKLEKLQVIVKLASESNIDSIISEIKEYANEVEIEFVRESIQVLGKCAVKVSGAADKCVLTLMDLIKSGVNYLVQESICVTRDIFRKYPMRYEAMLPILCEHLDTLDEPNAKSALIWILGEYAERIENSPQLVEHFLGDFSEEKSERVQLTLLTCTVKLFLKRPASTQELVQKLLMEATKSENPDIRDRAYIYWRLLSANPQICKNVVLAEKPPIEIDLGNVAPSLVEELILHLASLASVYHKPPAVVGNTGYVDLSAYQNDDEVDIDRKIALQQAAQVLGGPIIDNLLDLDIEISSSPVRAGEASGFFDTSSMEPYLYANQCGGLSVSGIITSSPLAMQLIFSNQANQPMNDFAIQFNVNTIGLQPAQALVVPPLSPGQQKQISLPLALTGGKQKMDPVNLLQVAIKNNIGTYYFSTLLPDSLMN